MRFVLRDGSRTFELGKAVDGRTDGAGQLRDSASAERFLRRFQTDPGAMVKLRQLAGHVSGQEFHRLGDDEMIRFLARRMAHGRITFLNGERRREEGIAAPATPAAAAPAAPRPAGSSMSSGPAPASEPSMFSATFDAAAQAAVLKSASESGTPFCEECERRRKEQAA